MSSVPKPKRKRVYTPEQLEAQKLRMRARREAAKKINPHFDSMRDDPRFQALMNRLRL